MPRVWSFCNHKRLTVAPPPRLLSLSVSLSSVLRRFAFLRTYRGALTPAEVAILARNASSLVALPPPSLIPSPLPTPQPAPNPTPAPTASPRPSPLPSPIPSPAPSGTPAPSVVPVPAPSPPPTLPPSPAPTLPPSPGPSRAPSPSPTEERPDGARGVRASVVYLSAYRDGFKGLDEADAAWLAADGVRAGASDCDDTPQTHVPLPFAVPYGGQRYRHVFLNPNGMLFFTKRPPCDSWFSAGPPCNFDSEPWGFYGGYVNLIAVFASDFNPADSEASVIRYVKSEEKIIVSWENLNLFGSSWMGYTFSVEIRASGHIRLHIGSVLFPTQVSDAPAWITEEGTLVALRFGGEQLNRTFITAEQQANRVDWLDGLGSSGTGVDGIYPPKASIHNYTRLDYCPVPTRLCLTPTVGSVLDAGLVLELASADAWGCDNDVFVFRCALSDWLAPASDPPLFVAPATVHGGDGGDGGAVVRCPVGGLGLVAGTAYAVRLQFASNGSAEVVGAWGAVESPFEAPVFSAGTGDVVDETCGEGGDGGGEQITCYSCGTGYSVR